jgi:hypothetical protein
MCLHVSVVCVVLLVQQRCLDLAASTAAGTAVARLLVCYFSLTVGRMYDGLPTAKEIIGYQSSAKFDGVTGPAVAQAGRAY